MKSDVRSCAKRRRPTYRSRSTAFTTALALLAGTVTALSAQDSKNLHGEVRDPLGAMVPAATVQLLVENPSSPGEDSRVAASTVSDAGGNFSFHVPASGRYRVRVEASSFQPVTTDAAYYSSADKAEIDVTLATKTLTQQVTVTATGTATPQAQIGASITVLTADDYRYATEVQDPLRLIPGLQVTQTGQTGGTTGLSIRGGETDANKVLIDGVPADAIGGGVEFANLSTVGIQSIEVLREPNSALYGSDALAGVVSLTTARGNSVLPLFTYDGDAGNFGTYRNEVTAGGVYRGFDLYSAFARLDTSNNIPGSEFHNATYVGNFGWQANSKNDLRFSTHHVIVSGGQPNAIALYGIPDDAQQKEQDNYYSAAWNNHATDKWHNEIRYGGLRLNSEFNSFGATGILDPTSGLYDGAPVVISGANGYIARGQALFQYSADPSQYLSPTRRDFVYAQTDYRLSTHVVALGGFKFEHESGSVGDAGQTPNAIERDNYSYTIQFAGDIRNRLFYQAGTGFEDNGLFGFAASPRLSLAYYLFRPSSARMLSGTKLHGSFGKGIKEPSVYQQSSSLYGTLSALPNGSQLVTQYNVAPLGPENSRTFDAGVDQQIANGRARIGITYFHNQFTNDVEYVPQSGLLQLGVPAANLTAFNFGGAYLNSSAFRSQGVEVETEYKLSNALFARGGYTYTDAVVQRSFSSDNLGPSFNTASNFSTVPIGAFSPLVGARPFRVAPHTGYLGVNYSHSKFYASLTGTLVSQRDDSDFLTDANFGNSLLLPNRNLLGGYQRLELGGGYQVTSRISLYTNMQNLLSEHYFEAFGFPALPFTFRSGIKLSFGGDSWKLR